jgi:hypothetical protein
MDIIASEMIARTLREDHERRVKQVLLRSQFRQAERDRKRAQQTSQSMLANVIDKLLHPAQMRTAKA